MSTSDLKLFAVYLGGRAPKCNTELHDVVFVVGSEIEATYEQLLDKWFGEPKELHIDSWLELRIVDGHRVTLRPNPAASRLQLYFINLGAYTPGEFTELHASAFLVAQSEVDAKRRAKASLLRGANSVHTDDLFAIEDCIALDEFDGQHVHLSPTREAHALTPHNGYHIIPRPIVATYLERKRLVS